MKFLLVSLLLFAATLSSAFAQDPAKFDCHPVVDMERQLLSQGAVLVETVPFAPQGSETYARWAQLGLTVPDYDVVQVFHNDHTNFSAVAFEKFSCVLVFYAFPSRQV